MAVVAFNPIRRGILKRQFQSHEDIHAGDMRRMLPKYPEENFPKILELVQGLKDVAKSHGSTSAQVALAWLLAQGPNIIPIPSTKSTTRMDENAASALLQLSDEVQGIRRLVEPTEVERTEINGTQYHTG